MDGRREEKEGRKIINNHFRTVRLNHTINEVASSSGSSSGPPEKRRRNGKDEKNVKGKNANK
jgi:hypothetical protein